MFIFRGRSVLWYRFDCFAAIAGLTDQILIHWNFWTVHLAKPDCFAQSHGCPYKDRSSTSAISAVNAELVRVYPLGKTSMDVERMPYFYGRIWNFSGYLFYVVGLEKTLHRLRAMTSNKFLKTFIWALSMASSQRHVRMRRTMDDPCRVGRKLMTLILLYVIYILRL